MPLQGFYESTALYNGNWTGGKWYDDAGKSAFASDPSWASLLQWQKDFITNVYGTDGYSEPLWFQDPHWSKPGLVLLGLWGVGSTMIIFLAALLNVPDAPVRGRRHRGSQRLGEVPPHHAADDQPGDLLLGRDRRDLRVPVLHRGVRGRAGRRRTDRSGERQRPRLSARTRRCSTRSGSTNRAFESFHLGYASAMAWVLFVIVMACTLVLIKSSNRWVFYQGGFR